MARNRARILLFLTLLLIASGVVAAFRIAWFRPYKGFSGAEKFIVVARGTSSLQVAHVLESEGIVRHWALFLSYLKVAQPRGRLQAGEYRFEDPISIAQVANKMVRGLVYYHELTVPEGYSRFEIAELLNARGFSTEDGFLEVTNEAFRLPSLNIELENAEGFLFPDTYRLARGTMASDIKRMMVKRSEEVYRSFVPELEHSNLSLLQAVTLASLIEKETGVDSERQLVSAVFHNRLRIKMPLQCDPTVVYAAKLRGKFRGRIFQSDLDFDSPFNTYRRIGLPPGPIANPGRLSMEAALNPADVDYLYFVADANGRHVFSKTLTEHQRAVTAYRNGLLQKEGRVPQRSASSKR